MIKQTSTKNPFSVIRKLKLNKPYNLNLCVINVLILSELFLLLIYYRKAKIEFYFGYYSCVLKSKSKKGIK